MQIDQRSISDHRSLTRALRELAFAIAILACIAIVARGQSLPPSAAVLMNEVVRNELTDRVQQRKWIYLIEKRDGNRMLSEEQVDTIDGPLFRLLAIDGTPLNPDQRQQDNARLDGLLRDSLQQSKAKAAHEQDEQMLEKVMRLLPETSLYEYGGTDGDLVKVNFRPNPAYKPATYEARLVHSLAGTVLVDLGRKRLAKFSGQVIDRIEFGYGLLGHIDKGGTIEIGRLEIEPAEWKTTFFNIQLSGRIAFFKTITKQSYETRRGFRAVSADLGLSAASQMLAR